MFTKSYYKAFKSLGTLQKANRKFLKAYLSDCRARGLEIDKNLVREIKNKSMLLEKNYYLYK